MSDNRLIKYIFDADRMDDTLQKDVLVLLNDEQYQDIFVNIHDELNMLPKTVIIPHEDSDLVDRFIEQFHELVKSSGTVKYEIVNQDENTLVTKGVVGEHQDTQRQSEDVNSNETNNQSNLTDSEHERLIELSNKSNRTKDEAVLFDKLMAKHNGETSEPIVELEQPVDNTPKQSVVQSQPTEQSNQSYSPEEQAFLDDIIPKLDDIQDDLTPFLGIDKSDLNVEQSLSLMGIEMNIANMYQANQSSIQDVINDSDALYSVVEDLKREVVTRPTKNIRAYQDKMNEYKDKQREIENRVEEIKSEYTNELQAHLDKEIERIEREYREQHPDHTEEKVSEYRESEKQSLRTMESDLERQRNMAQNDAYQMLTSMKQSNHAIVQALTFLRMKNQYKNSITSMIDELREEKQAIAERHENQEQLEREQKEREEQEREQKAREEQERQAREEREEQERQAREEREEQERQAREQSDNVQDDTEPKVVPIVSQDDVDTTETSDDLDDTDLDMDALVGDTDVEDVSDDEIDNAQNEAQGLVDDNDLTPEVNDDLDFGDSDVDDYLNALMSDDDDNIDNDTSNIEQSNAQSDVPLEDDNQSYTPAFDDLQGDDFDIDDTDNLDDFSDNQSDDQNQPFDDDTSDIDAAVAEAEFDVDTSTPATMLDDSEPEDRSNLSKKERKKLAKQDKKEAKKQAKLDKKRNKKNKGQSEPKAEKPKKPAGRGTKILGMIVAIVVFLTLIGGGGYFIFSLLSGSDQEETPTEETPTEQIVEEQTGEEPTEEQPPEEERTTSAQIGEEYELNMGDGTVQWHEVIQINDDGSVVFKSKDTGENTVIPYEAMKEFDEQQAEEENAQ